MRNYELTEYNVVFMIKTLEMKLLLACFTFQWFTNRTLTWRSKLPRDPITPNDGLAVPPYCPVLTKN